VTDTQKRSFRIALFAAWLVGIGLTAYVVPHPLLHSEWQDPQWRAASARRSLWIAPFTYLGPIVIAAFAHRLGWDPTHMLQTVRAIRGRGRAHFSIILCLANAFLLFVIVLFLTILGP
jgi:hypothetical protein